MPLLGTLGEGSSRSYGLYGNTGVGGRAAIPLTISTNTYNYDVYTNRGPTYVAGFSDITVTVNAPVTVGSTATPTYALLVPSAFSPTDTVTIVNNGVIQGMGGGGGPGGNAPGAAPVPATAVPGVAGGTGGNAIYVNRPTTITNNGTVASGGGGGGGGGSVQVPSKPQPAGWGGGGGGGGAGLNGGAAGAGGTGKVGPSPSLGGPGSTGAAGTSPAGGAGGSGFVNGAISGGTGGTGGGRGAAGASGNAAAHPNPSIARFGAPGAGGATGNYIVGNPFVTWPVTGTRQGNVA